MSTSILHSIEKLKCRENYSTWKFAMQSFLELEGLIECVSLETIDAANETKEKKAKGALILSIDPINYVHVRGAKTSKEVWDKLQATFEDTGSARRVALVRKIVNTKLENCSSMEEYVNEIMSAAHKLCETGYAVPDDWLAIFLLAGLTDQYTPMIMTIENSGDALSSDSVKTKLLQELPKSSSSNEENAL